MKIYVVNMYNYYCNLLNIDIIVELYNNLLYKMYKYIFFF